MHKIRSMTTMKNMLRHELRVHNRRLRRCLLPRIYSEGALIPGLRLRWGVGAQLGELLV